MYSVWLYFSYLTVGLCMFSIVIYGGLTLSLTLTLTLP